MPPPLTPEFWARRGFLSSLLQPLAWGYVAGAAARRRWTRPERLPLPVICVGNLVVGGAGKTPVVLSLAARLTARRERVHILSRGYGGSLAGPVRVDPARHSAAEVGDEPLLLAAAGPTWVGRNRVAAGRAARDAGASLLLLDDGLQNPRLAKDLSLLVVDGAYGFGNGRVLPAGPLREALAQGIAHADTVVLMGEDRNNIAARLGGKPVLHARLVAEGAQRFAGQRVAAFAGIGRPAKFFESLEEAGAILASRHGFADHHAYSEAELRRLAAAADAAGAALVTTEKDQARLSPKWQARVEVLRVAVAWQDEAALDRLLQRIAA
ncbi:MAG TPA: tetraacyldisaccharide 4'-kinase [Stellaceae bacterium]|nr:tetraacyldisaccharide 4'-kinase [Stellaceae bacterium]